MEHPVMLLERQRLIRGLFDEYIEMYAGRDDRLTTRFSQSFSGYAGSSDRLVTDREEWIKVTRLDFAQVPERIRIEMLDLALQDLSDDVVAVTGDQIIAGAAGQQGKMFDPGEARGHVYTIVVLAGITCRQ